MKIYTVYCKVAGQWENLGLYEAYSKSEAILKAKQDSANSKYLGVATEWRATSNG